jgi:hypothetical protein
VKGNLSFNRASGSGAVVFKKAVAVGAVGKWDVEELGVVESLLHAIAKRVRIVFSLNDRNGEIGLVVEQIIDFFCFAAFDALTPYDHPALGEVEFLADLRHRVPFRSI